jgi:hypothetical protein
MRAPAHYRLIRLKGIRALFRFLLITPSRQSLRMFNVICSELDDMIAECEVELELETLVTAKTANQQAEPSDGSAPTSVGGEHLPDTRMLDRQGVLQPLR